MEHFTDTWFCHRHSIISYHGFATKASSKHKKTVCIENSWKSRQTKRKVIKSPCLLPSYTRPWMPIGSPHAHCLLFVIFLICPAKLSLFCPNGLQPILSVAEEQSIAKSYLPKRAKMPWTTLWPLDLSMLSTRKQSYRLMLRSSYWNLESRQMKISSWSLIEVRQRNPENKT